MGSRRARSRSITYPWETGLLGRAGRVRVRWAIFGVASLGVLATLASRQHEQDARRQTREAIRKAERAVATYRAERDTSCPGTWNDLVVAGVMKAPPTDAWGHELRLVCPGARARGLYEVLSDGPDGEPYGLDRVE